MSTLNQIGDVLFYQTLDGGEMNIENGLSEMTVLESSVYLCLVGGNVEDDASPSGEKYQWSGNEDEPEEFRFRSRFLSLLNGRPITSQLIRDIGEAAALDIIDGHPGYISAVECSVSIDGHRKITVVSNITLASGDLVRIITEIQRQ
jgi:hypothetical protein